MSSDSLDQWLQRLESLHPSEIDLGLERVAEVAQRLDLIPVTVPVITIAGTNGKGSTAAVLEALLAANGHKVGVCSSPHFLRFNERIRVAGVEVDDAQIVAAFEEIDRAREAISLTYFEFSTLAALWVFRASVVDMMVLEVGLGGRLDAVNIVDSSVAVITSIELDHQDWLGDTRELIAPEKAGIFRRGCPAVIADASPPESLNRCVREAGVKAYYLGEHFSVDHSPRGWRGSVTEGGGNKRALPEFSEGAILPVNIAAAIQALLLLGESISDSNLADVVADVGLAGRRQSINVSGVDYFLDVAHNPAAVHKMLEYINVTPCNGRTIALFSVMKDKELQPIVEACAPYFEAWMLADQPDNPRAASATDIADVLRAKGCERISTSKNLTQAFRRGQTLMDQGDRMVVFGSFFTVAAAMAALAKDLGKKRL